MSIEIYKMRYEDTLKALDSLMSIGLKDKKNLTGAEIGCYSGESSYRFIKSGKFDKFFCIDPWENGYDNNDPASYSNHLAEKLFDENVKTFNNVIKIKNYSYKVFDLFEDQSLDFIYIDGCHTYDGVKTDLTNYFKKVKNNGIICGHDYILEGDGWAGVKRAVLEFFKGTPPHHTFNDNSWLYFKEKL